MQRDECNLIVHCKWHNGLVSFFTKEYFCYCCKWRLYATTFATACRRLASAEVFSPMNLHCMKEQLDLWPSLRGWPSDTTPSQFTAGKALREKQAYAIWRIFWNLLLTKKHTSATLARRASVLGSYRYFHHWWLSAGTEGMASVYWVICHQLMTASHSWSFNNKSLKSRRFQIKRFL